MAEKLGRGDEVRRPTGWVVRLIDRQAAKGWETLLTHAPGNLDRAWVAITADPRCRDSLARQHPLRLDLGHVDIDGVAMEQWQYEVTGGGRIWYAIDDARRTVWITQAGTAHPRQTDKRRR
ncbi:hypothetical protein FOH10_28885 [Nocardia otitidiscaviarum]|uniref:Type II toxin-antitoxin system RelE/ParE family toxin n=1 Tax=Nocardia otitidiscaviarum TaxID=1823 RepID=A0A516NTB0_9NOCA|nr:hypothetical protein [Nocardia otitidiscaviarum]MCP9621450.1 hypothetical protein [Nocardia otitidiscaviarum]QDP82147.1 hypothetical protein FOH10_28885 [Nocardia otitidiscaviarum]